MAHHGGGGAGFCIWRPNKTTSLYYEFSPDKTTKTTSLYYEINVGFVARNR